MQGIGSMMSDLLEVLSLFLKGDIGLPHFEPHIMTDAQQPDLITFACNLNQQNLSTLACL